MSAFRLGLLWCGHVHPDALDLGGDYPSLFGELFEPLGAEIVPYAVDIGQFPTSVAECDAWITSPSRNSVNDDEPWIDQLAELVRNLVRTETPFAGICFGHQLLATALGGRVERAEVGWGVGVQRYDITQRREWMDPWPGDSAFSLVASHEDQVTHLPDGATVLATAPSCPVAAMEVGERAISGRN